MFFNLFAAAEPSVNVCVAHGTLSNDLSVYIATTAQNCGWEFRSRQIRSVSAKHWQQLVEPQGSAEPRLKNIAVRSPEVVVRDPAPKKILTKIPRLAYCSIIGYNFFIKQTLH